MEWEGREAEAHPPRLIDKYIPRASQCLHVASTIFKQHVCLIIHLMTPFMHTGRNMCVGKWTPTHIIQPVCIVLKYSNTCY